MATMHAKTVIAAALALLMSAESVSARQRAESPEVWRQYADRLPSGALVHVALKNGTSVTGHVIQVAPDMLRVEPKTRIPAPVRNVAYDEIEWISTRQEGKSPGAKVLLGVGIAAASVFGLFLIALASIAD